MAQDGSVLYAQRPDSLRGLRACITCKLLKTLNQFADAFCENCQGDWAGGSLPSSMNRQEATELALEHTTDDFEGLVAMMRPTESWVAKWLKMRE